MKLSVMAWIRIAVVLGIVVFVAAGLYSQAQQKQTHFQQETYEDCVYDASKHLSETIPGLSLMDARTQARISPRCSALQP